MAYAADMTAAWYAAAPPPPPVSLEAQVPPAPINPRLRRDSWRNRTGRTDDGVVRSSSSTASVGFDARAKGDDLPLDSHAPEPERPVSRNAMARIREKERQRARTSSTSAYQTRVPTTRADMHHHQQPSIVAPYHQADSYSSIRERHDSSPATAAPYSMYSKQPTGYDQPALPLNAVPAPGYPADHGYFHGGYWPSHSETPAPMAASYQCPPASVTYSPMTSAPATPMIFPAYNSAPPSAQPPYSTFWEPTCASPVRQPVPFPTNTAMPPPTIPASHLAQVHAGHHSQHPVSTSRPLPSPSRSSSQSSSVGTGPSSPSLNSLTGTIRRSLPQPPSGTLSRMSTNDSPSTLRRHDSVRMAAEEIMARGPPRRKNISAGSRFSGSPLTSKSDEVLPSETTGGMAESHKKYSVRVARAESASCLEKEMRELKLKEEICQERESYEIERRSQVSTVQAVAPLRKEILRAASPRPIRAAPEPAPAISIDVPVEEILPARPLSRGPKDERERRRSMADAAHIPVIFSPPPDAKPPVPTFCFDLEEPEVRTQSNAPSIVLPGEENAQAPMVAIEAPSIQLSSEDADAEEDAGPKASISVSVSSSGIAQRSLTTDFGSIHAATSPSQQYNNNNNNNNNNNHHQHQHQHHHLHDHDHNHTHATPRGPAPASASSIGSGASCATCQKWIGGRVVHAMNLTFHPDCFVCCHCSEHLEHVAFYEHEGRPYCHFDFHELFSKRCFHCRTPIVDQRYITINDVDLVGGNAEERCYHDLHFFCANCGDPFMDPKLASSAAGSASTEIFEDADGKVRFGDGSSREFVVHKGYPYCEKCHVSLHKPRCKGCKQPIIDAEFLTALKGKWHLNCFCCQVCQHPISTDNFFVKDGQAYDEECYKIKLRSEL